MYLKETADTYLFLDKNNNKKNVLVFLVKFRVGQSYGRSRDTANTECLLWYKKNLEF